MGQQSESFMNTNIGHNGLSISRRNFLRSGALTAAAVPAVSSLGLARASADTPARHANQHAFETSPDFLESAKGAAQWIESAQMEDSRGVYWLPEPDHPERATTVSAANTIYSGSARDDSLFHSTSKRHRRDAIPRHRFFGSRLPRRNLEGTSRQTRRGLTLRPWLESVLLRWPFRRRLCSE